MTLMHRMVNHLDAPRRYFTLTVDELCMTCVGMLLMVVSSHKLLTVLLCGLLFSALRSLKHGKGPRHLWVLSYWYLPALTHRWMLNKLPASHHRVWQV